MYIFLIYFYVFIENVLKLKEIIVLLISVLNRKYVKLFY